MQRSVVCVCVCVVACLGFEGAFRDIPRREIRFGWEDLLSLATGLGVVTRPLT
jgi:hypothetical protein